MPPNQYHDVWDAIEDTPGDATKMKMRSELIAAIQNHIGRVDMEATAAAKLLELDPQKLANLIQGKISEFGLEALIDMAARLGLEIEMRITDPT